MNTAEDIKKFYNQKRLLLLEARDKAISDIEAKTSPVALKKMIETENASSTKEDCEYEGDPLPEGFLYPSEIWATMDKEQQKEADLYMKATTTARLEYARALAEVLTQEESAMRKIGAIRTV